MSKKSIHGTSRDGSDKTLPQAEGGHSDDRAGLLARVMRILSGIISALGLGRRKQEKESMGTGDISTSLAHQRTNLAMDRNYLAAERTLMAWIRTSLSMISFGFTIGKLGQAIAGVEVKRWIGSVRTMSIENVAYFLVILGTFALVAAALQHRQRIHKLRAMGLRRQISITFIIAVLLAVLGVFVFSALVLAL